MKSDNEFVRTETGMIPEDWEVRRIGDFVDIKHGYAFKGEFFTDVPTENVVLTPGNFNIGGGFKAEKLKYTVEEPPRDYVLREGDIIVTMTDLSKNGDTLGYAAKVPRKEGMRFLHNQRLGLLQFKASVSKDFLFWVLRTRRYNSFVVGSASGSTVKHTSPDRIKQYSFGIPTSYSEQEAIAKTLSDLDLKIELNQQMSKTLEAISQAIFRHWFVDFEFPNGEGKPYKSSEGEMVYSEELRNDIPREWTVGKTSEIVRQLKEQVSTSVHAEQIYNHYSIEAYDSGMKPTLQQGSEILSSKFVVRHYTVLVSKINPRIQRIWPVINAAANSICSTEFLVFEPRKHAFCYFYHLIFSQKIWQDMIQMARGTSSSHQRISSNDILDYPILIPPQEILESFERITFPNVAVSEQNVTNELTLQQIRDALLPKLMRGKIRVPVEAR